MIEKFVEAVGKIVLDYLELNEIPHFVGGSRRFGYHNESSDMDIYASIKDVEKAEDYKKVLRQNGFKFDYHAEKMYGTTPYNFQNMIHIIVMMNNRAYDRLSAEHTTVESFINENPILRDVARTLKIQGMSGSAIYRTFINMMRVRDLKR